MHSKELLNEGMKYQIDEVKVLSLEGTCTQSLFLFRSNYDTALLPGSPWGGWSWTSMLVTASVNVKGRLKASLGGGMNKVKKEKKVGRRRQ